MKNALNIILGLTTFFFILYFADQYNKMNTHPTLNKSAELPDEYLVDMVVAHQRGIKDLCLTKLEGAIDSFWDIEKDVDSTGVLIMEEAVQQLESLHKNLTIEAASDSSVRQVYKESLKHLALVEFLVAKNQMKNNDINKAKVALRYVITHLNNSMLFLNSEVDYEEIESLKNTAKQLEELIINEDLKIPDFQNHVIIDFYKNVKD